MKYKQEVALKSGWSRWIKPSTIKYKMACCGCGLVHQAQFRVVRIIGEHSPTEDLVTPVKLPRSKFIEYRVKVDVAATAAIRRHRK